MIGHQRYAHAHTARHDAAFAPQVTEPAPVLSPPLAAEVLWLQARVAD